MSDFLMSEDGAAYISATPLASTSSGTALGSATLCDIIIEGISTDQSADTVSIKGRRHKPYALEVPSFKNVKIKFKVLWEPGDDVFDILSDAWANNSEIAFWDLDRPKATDGAKGLAGNFKVSVFNKTAPMPGVQAVDVELSPTGYQHIHEVSA